MAEGQQSYSGAARTARSSRQLPLQQTRERSTTIGGGYLTHSDALALLQTCIPDLRRSCEGLFYNNTCRISVQAAKLLCPSHIVGR